MEEAHLLPEQTSNFQKGFLGHSTSQYYAPTVYPGGSAVKTPPAIQEPQETRVKSLGWEDPLEEGRVTHSNSLVWRIPWAEKPDGPQFMGPQRVGHD